MWAQQIRLLKTGQALLKLVNDPNLYRVNVQRHAPGYLASDIEQLVRRNPAALEAVDRFIEQNYTQDFFVSPAVIERETDERLQRLLNPAIFIPSIADSGTVMGHWYFGYKDENGQQRTKKGYTDRKATAELAAKFEQEARRRRDGLIDLAEEKLADQRKAPINSVLEVYEKNLKGRRTTVKHVTLTLARVRRLIQGCEFKILSDIQTEAVQDFLDELAEEDFGHRTYNHYVQAIEGFGNWLVSTKRSALNPFTGLTRLNTEVDIRHKRRALSVEEVGQLIESARASKMDIQCFTPEERARIYIISCLTGLRRKEIASLTPRSFALKADPPMVTVEAACSKHRRMDVLPLHPQLIELLPEWLRGLSADQVLFPKLAKRRTWLMVKKDLERIGIPYETAEGIADFHAAGRHTYITGLLKNGVSLPEAKELARHSDVNMTMRYTHIGIQDRAKAVARIPNQERFRWLWWTFGDIRWHSERLQ